MTVRQKRGPMSEALARAIKRVEDWAEKYGFETQSETVDEMAATLVLSAYESPIYPSISTFDESRQDEIDEFENFYFEKCYKGSRSVTRG